MNILMLLTPKKNVAFLSTEMTVKEALNSLKLNRFSSVPLIDLEGFYIGAITEGDMLWFLEQNGTESALETSVGKVPRNRDNLPVNINEEVNDLLLMSLNQNFIPILDDRGYFIGIVTRKDVLKHFLDKMHAGQRLLGTRNHIIQALYSRRSIRKFKNEVIEQNIIDEILNTALVSPTAANRKPTHVMFIDDKKTIKALSETHIRGGQFANAPYLMLILNDDEVEVNPFTANSNAAALTMSLLLAIDSYEEIGGYWIATRHLDNNRVICQTVNIADSFSLYAIIAFGIKDEFKPENTAEKKERIHRNKW